MTYMSIQVSDGGEISANDTLPAYNMIDGFESRDT